MSGSNSFGPAVKAAPEDAAALRFTVHSMPTPDARERRTLVGRLQMLLLLLVCAAPVVASYFTYFVIRPEGRRVNYSELISPQRPIPPGLPLADLDGKPVSAASLTGQWILVVVSGGACDAGCEQHLWIQRQLRETLGRDKERLDKLWLIDDDAAPRPETLQAVQHIVGSEPATVLRAPRAALAAWLQEQPGDALERHMFIVDPVGNAMMRVPANPDPGRLKSDISRLLRASGVWVRPGL
jgi:hypothetical protein